tara:strand:+ start:244 stop:447 length:204 start_codon:yes stop_codon:yes gene_type:complete
MFTSEEKKLIMVLTYEEYERLLSEKARLSRTGNKYVRGNKQDRLIEIQAEIQRAQDILQKLDDLDSV